MTLCTLNDGFSGLVTMRFYRDSLNGQAEGFERIIAFKRCAVCNRNNTFSHAFGTITIRRRQDGSKQIRTQTGRAIFSAEQMAQHGGKLPTGRANRRVRLCVVWRAQMHQNQTGNPFGLVCGIQ